MNVFGTANSAFLPSISRTLAGSYYFGHGPISSFTKNDTILFYFEIALHFRLGRQHGVQQARHLAKLT